MANRVYTKEFKTQAVELARSLGSNTKAAEQLGIPAQNIYKWENGPSEKQSMNINTSKKSETDLKKKSLNSRKLTIF
jgi:transposase-like protein